MKKNFHYLYVVIAVNLFFAVSCKKNILDKTPLDAISETAVWTDPNLINTFVNGRYNQIGHGWYSESWVSSMCDETFLTWSRSTEPITQGYVSPSTKHSMNGGHWGDNILRRWDQVWKNIANCNIFFDNVNKATFTTPGLKERLTAEVTFIRALMYWDLINRWGAMPLITKSYGIDNVSEISKIKRNTYKENIDFLIAECDKAIAVLPGKYSGNSDKGRATSVAALALKSRILLYAASPLMNNVRGDDPNFFVHYQTPDAARWQKAADAAQAAITVALSNGHALLSSNDVKQTYTDIFMKPGNVEVIFDRQGGASTTGTNLGYIDEANGPNGFGAWGGNTPISEFVDDFEMSDGSKFDWNNPVHKANPFVNRDARLYATVLNNGDIWKGGVPVESYYFTKPDGSQSGGKDTKYGRDSWNTSASGYNVRKFLDITEAQGSWNFNPRNWIWFRLGELYLNLAEAKFNAGDESGARAALNVIRDRARMPQVTSSGTALWNAIVNERRIELAFEEHRYFDVRRWMIADVVLNRNATGITIFKEANGTFTYTPGTSPVLPRLVEVRKFVAPKMYWLPIQLDEINKNPNLGQNPGY